MPDRSSLLRGVLAAAAAALLALAPAAGAKVTVPPGAPVVAGPTAHGATLTVFTDRGRLCAAVHQPEQPTDDPGFDDPAAREPTCIPMPVLGPFGTAESLGPTAYSGSRFADVGAVGPGVAAVEWRRGGRVVAHADTVGSPLPGAAGDVRFYLAERSDGDRPDEIVLLDAAGTVRRAADFDGAGFPEYPSTDGGTVDPGSRRVLQRGGRAPAAWTVRSWIRRPIASTPLQPERRIALPCVSFVHQVPGAGFGGGSQSVCDDEHLAAAPLISLNGQECGAIGAYVGGIVRPGVRRLAAVLADGTRRAVPLAGLPGAPAGTRAGVLVLGNGVGVRRLVAVGRDGAASSVHVGSRPVRYARCSRRDLAGGLSLILYSTGLPTTVLGHGPHAAQVADDGALVCLAIDRAPRRPGDCGPAPVDVAAAGLDTQPTAEGRYVAGFVPPEVTAARLTLDDGTRRDVAASTVPGQYAGALGLVAADVPGPHRVTRYALLDARGRVLSEQAGPELPPLQQGRTVLRTPGLPPLTTAVRPRFGPVPRRGCLTLAPVADSATDACGLADEDLFTVRALCAPRRIVLYGLLARAGDRLTVRLADGRDVPARTARVPAAVSRRGVAALVVLGPHDAARKLVRRRRGHRAATKALVLPPVAQQCGYGDFLALNDPFADR